MIMIAGLGNPGRDYEKTRHNMGFDTVDVIAERAGIRVRNAEGRALTGKGIYAGEKVLLVKPLTYMNLSGESIRALIDYYKIDAEKELVVISDDITLPLGKLRIRMKGSAGGHNGLKNIIAQLGHDRFRRIKIGVGEKPEEYDLINYVLGRFSKEDRVIVEESINRAADAVATLLEEGAEKAMNKYN